jgi:hypothetical protein
MQVFCHPHNLKMALPEHGLIQHSNDSLNEHKNITTSGSGH